MSKCYAIIALCLALMYSSCSNISVYNQNIDIHRETWNMDSVATFKVEITDTLSAHSVFVNVRNTIDYRYSNFFIFINTSSPQNAILKDTIECVLADKRGKWLGKGFGALRDNQIPYKQYIRFPEKGIYTFTLQQGMRDQNLKGIASVGIKVEKQKLE